MKDLGLSPFEQHILDRSSNLGITRRRRTTVIITGLIAAALLVWAAFIKQSWQFVLLVSLIYVAVTIWEKVAYANAVLLYKNLIQKLKTRIEELYTAA